MKQVLVVDGDRAMRDGLKERLEYEGYRVETSGTRDEALEQCERKTYDLVLCDVTPGGLDPIQLLKTVRSQSPTTDFIMMSALKTCDMAVLAIRGGASDIISKPIDLNRLLSSVRGVFEAKSEAPTTEVPPPQSSPPQEQEPSNVAAKEQPKQKTGGPTIIGESMSIEHVKSMINKVAPSDARVFILGENGTGKELVAHYLHQKSPRAHGPFVEVNCAAIPSELIESELFGHEKGAFTSAVKQRKGKFEQAHGGTLFLDEVGDMSLSAQAKVLRALQEHKITRVGSDKDINVDVRVFAATNKDLLEEIKNHNFREDLYHRLSVIVIRVPTLRERIEDIPLLVDFFIERICSDYGIEKKGIETKAIDELLKLEWTGNIRELHNVVERLIILCGKTITYDDVMMYAVGMV